MFFDEPFKKVLNLNQCLVQEVTKYEFHDYDSYVQTQTNTSTSVTVYVKHTHVTSPVRPSGWVFPTDGDGDGALVDVTVMAV